MFSINTGQTARFSYNGWLSKSDAPYKLSVELTAVAEAGQANLSRYLIVVYTSDLRGAGTDANVSAVIHGTKGATALLPLENSANNFEKGARDEFVVETADVGPLNKLQIGHDNKCVVGAMPSCGCRSLSPSAAPCTLPQLARRPSASLAADAPPPSSR